MPDLKADRPGEIQSALSAVPGHALRVAWQDGISIVNLRGDPMGRGFRDAVARALGVALPVDHLRIAWNSSLPCPGGAGLAVVPAGPDDWFVIGPRGGADALILALRQALAGHHVAITDVSSGYTVLRLAGPPVREVLAQGCPLDLHPRAFGPGRCAGSHFFKASVWIWQAQDAATFNLLVRRSFMGYVRLMLAHATLECGLEEDRGPSG